MKHRILLKAVTLLVSAGMLSSLAACGSKGNNDLDNDEKAAAQSSSKTVGKIDVVASIGQWGSLAEQIGGKHVQVQSIVNGTSGDAHDFEPQTADIAKIQKAQVLLTNGAGYDDWAGKSIAKKTTSVSASELTGTRTGSNPHLWFSKIARQAVALSLKNTFIAIEPRNATDFKNNYEKWQSQEKTLEDKMQSFKDAHNGTPYVATESVAHYLMDDLGLQDVTPKGYARSSSSEGEPSPSDLQKFKTILSSRQAALLINNTQEANDATNILTGTAGRSEVPVVDVSEQMPENEKNLVTWVTHLMNNVTQALKKFDGTAVDHPVSPDNTSGAGDASNSAGDGTGSTTPQPSPSPTAPSAPSNEGQTDPGK